MNRIALSEQDKTNYKAVSFFFAVGAMLGEMWMTCYIVLFRAEVACLFDVDF